MVGALDARAPGMFVAHLTRVVAKTGGTLVAHLRLPDQTESELTSLWALCQEKEITALAHLSLWVGTGAARPVLGLSAGPPGRRTDDPLCHPACLGRCGT